MRFALGVGSYIPHRSSSVVWWAGSVIGGDMQRHLIERVATFVAHPAHPPAIHPTPPSARARFYLISYRQDVLFAFMRGGTMSPRLVTTSDVIRVTNPNEPLQGRLALTGGGPR